MEQENFNSSTEEQVKENALFKVTPFSKYLALALFVALPFIGGWIGYQYAPDKIVEVEKVVYKETAIEDNQADVWAKQVADGVLQPSVVVVSYENSEPLSSIKVAYENLPDNTSALALCLSSGGCTEWVDSFTPIGQKGVYSMNTTKNLGEGEYIIVVIGDEFSDQIVASEPFVIDLEGGNSTQTTINWATFEIEDTVNPSITNEIKWKYNANIFSALPEEKTYALFAVVDREGTVVNSSVVGDGVNIDGSINSVTWGGNSSFVPAEDIYGMLKDGEQYRYKVTLGYAAEPNENNSFKELAAQHISWSEWFTVDWNN